MRAPSRLSFVTPTWASFAASRAPTANVFVRPAVARRISLSLVPFVPPQHIVEEDVALADTRLHVRRWGHGPPLYLIHGGPGGSGAYWPHALPYLGDHRTVYAIDLRGHGESDRTPPYTIPRLAADVRGLAAALGHDTYGLLGHSFGSLVAMCAATDNDAIDRLVLVGGFPSTLHTVLHPRGMGTKLRLGLHLALWNLQRVGRRDPALRPILGKLLRRARPLLHADRRRAARIDARLFAAVKEPLDPVMPLQAALVRWDHRAGLAQISAPTLLVIGTQDALARPAARDMLRRIPDARLVWVRRAGHSPFFDQPHVFRDAVVPFLSAPGKPS